MVTNLIAMTLCFVFALAFSEEHTVSAIMMIIMALVFGLFAHLHYQDLEERVKKLEKEEKDEKLTFAKALSNVTASPKGRCKNPIVGSPNITCGYCKGGFCYYAGDCEKLEVI